MERSTRPPDPPADEASRELRRLPAVGRLLDGPAAALLRRWGRPLVTAQLREVVERLRRRALAGEIAGAELRRAAAPAALVRAARTEIERLLAPRPRRVINATGVVVHTNLGRAPLSADAARGLARLASGYVDLEYDVATGARGSRLDALRPLMERLFPGAGFAVVNNNAAAITLCLRALCRDREALISRGELVEIGGSFRVPELMAISGARLREVGTTNRTRLADYEAALGERSGILLKVHTSNFRIVGFTEETAVGDLAGLARRSGVPFVVDQGSGVLEDLAPFGIDDERPVRSVLADGADLVTFSGDKLLGGPQAGFVVGRPELVERVRRDPLARVCRLDRALIGALERTLAAHVAGRALEEVPTLRMIALDAQAIGRRAAVFVERLAAATGTGEPFAVVDGVSRTGGGSSPAGERPTRLVAIAWPPGDSAPLDRALRASDPPVVGRVQGGRLLLDLRTVDPADDERLARLVARAVTAVGPAPEQRFRR